MVELGLYAVTRLYWVVFAAPLAPHVAAVRAIFVALGVVTALLAAIMCFLQTHIKRLLAFSTISHVGILLCAVALLSSNALAGAAVYIVGHGLTKGALFMCAGVLLHRFATIDEYMLRGRGRELPFVGVLMATGGLLLAGLPPFTTFMGKSLLEDSSAAVGGYGWLIALYVLISAVTGGAVLRVTARVFLGWGAAEGPDPGQARIAQENIDDTRGSRDHTPVLMMIVPAVLLTGALVLGLVPGAVAGAERVAAQFVAHREYGAWVLHGAHVPFPVVGPSHTGAVDYRYGVLSVAGALLFAWRGLRTPTAQEIPHRPVHRRIHVVATAIRGLHSGHVGDYISWWSAGVSLIGGVCLVALR